VRSFSSARFGRAGAVLWNGPRRVRNRGVSPSAQSRRRRTGEQKYGMERGRRGDWQAAVEQLGVAGKIGFISTGGESIPSNFEGKKSRRAWPPRTQRLNGRIHRPVTRDAARKPFDQECVISRTLLQTAQADGASPMSGASRR